MNVLSNWTVREKKPNTLKPFTEMIFGDRVFIHLLTTNINVTDHATKSLTLAHIIITNDLLADSMTNNHVAYGFFLFCSFDFCVCRRKRCRHVFVLMVPLNITYQPKKVIFFWVLTQIRKTKCFGAQRHTQQHTHPYKYREYHILSVRMRSEITKKTKVSEIIEWPPLECIESSIKYVRIKWSEVECKDENNMREWKKKQQLNCMRWTE